MKSIEEHNEEKRKTLHIKTETGIQCPHCGDEMHYSEPGVLLLTNPPKRKVHCKTCKYQTTIL
jgi:DNA-directed RNA polymerase subunit RPC12/RpoP